MYYAVPPERDVEGYWREIIQYVPGYQGYRQRKSRRSEDKRLRIEISRRLAREVWRLEAVEKDAFLSGLRSSAVALAEARARLREISDFAQSAPCSNPRFFEDKSPSSVRLRWLQEADLEMFRATDSIVRCISKLEQADLPLDERESRIHYLAGFIDRLCAAFDGREGIMAEWV